MIVELLIIGSGVPTKTKPRGRMPRQARPMQAMPMSGIVVGRSDFVRVVVVTLYEWS